MGCRGGEVFGLPKTQVLKSTHSEFKENKVSTLPILGTSFSWPVIQEDGQNSQLVRGQQNNLIQAQELSWNKISINILHKSSFPELPIIIEENI